MPRHIPCGAGRAGEDVLVEVNTRHAHPRDEGEDVARQRREQRQEEVVLAPS